MYLHQLHVNYLHPLNVCNTFVTIRLMILSFLKFSLIVANPGHILLPERGKLSQRCGPRPVLTCHRSRERKRVEIWGASYFFPSFFLPTPQTETRGGWRDVIWQQSRALLAFCGKSFFRLLKFKVGRGDQRWRNDLAPKSRVTIQ